MSGQVLDLKNWRVEANAVKKDIQNHVKHIEVVDGNDQLIYLNLTTLEGKNLCLELSANGFRVVGESYNMKDGSSEEYFETPYSLLNSVSPQFCQSFGNDLVAKLNKLKNDRK